MTAQVFDDAELRAAMTAFLDAARRLDESSSVGDEARNLLDLAEAKTLAAMQLRKRLNELGWAAPRAAERANT
ncbi:MAG: hypothetical protein QOJ79_845 [Actinomycetota bacterium]|jgi:hypothetical protein|nr:hypothetical protein [Actinomycetota bacterium]